MSQVKVNQGNSANRHEEIVLNIAKAVIDGLASHRSIARLVNKNVFFDIKKRYSSSELDYEISNLDGTTQVELRVKCPEIEIIDLDKSVHLRGAWVMVKRRCSDRDVTQEYDVLHDTGNYGLALSLREDREQVVFVTTEDYLPNSYHVGDLTVLFKDIRRLSE